MSQFKRTWAQINLSAISYNLKNIKKILAPKTGIMAVVKADAYGHGALACAKELIKNGIDFFAVACLEEALELRRGGIKNRIIILGYTPGAYFDTLLEYDITQTVFDLDLAIELDKKARILGKKAKIHIKLNTGMNRLGLSCSPEEKEKTIKDIISVCRLENIEAEGIFTHFAAADDPQDDFTLSQFNTFMDFIKTLENEDITFKYRHCANSAAALYHPEMQLDMVRLGIILYGLSPNMDRKSPVDLKPVMELKTLVAQIREIKKGQTVSYNMTYTAKKDIKIAILPVGYADGYSRALSGKANVSINGQTAPQIGKICMDYIMVDISDLKNAPVPGDEVTLFGNAQISADDLAKALDTINYEITCNISKRVSKIIITANTLL